MEYPVPPNIDSFSNDSAAPKFWVTPFRISLIDLVYRYLQNKNSEPTHFGLSWKQRIHLCEKLLGWILGPDLKWKEFAKELDEVREGFSNEVYLSLKVYDLEGVALLFKDVDRLISGERNRFEKLDPSSPIGLFLRRNLIAFKSLTMIQTSKLLKNFALFLSKTTSKSMNLNSDDIFDNDESMFDLSGLSLDPAADDPEKLVKGSFNLSKKQSEFFISKHIYLLLQNEAKALPPKELQNVINELLTNNEQQSEVLYLQYLNSLRVRDYTLCLNTLIHYFDCKSNAIGGATANLNPFNQPDDDIARSFRFAALNVAMFHVEMGHWKIAEAAIKEAIRMALETNDMMCLQHALMWSQIIEDEMDYDCSNVLKDELSNIPASFIWDTSANNG